MNMKMIDLTFDQITIGQTAEFEQVISDEDMAAFASLTGNLNPLHTDEAYAAGTQFGGIIVYGMLAASYFSTLLGMYLPGKRALCLSQSFDYRKPIRPGEKVIVKGTVTHRSPATRILTIKTEVLNERGEACVDGSATVQVL